jgi:hypothetical protein
LKITATKSNEIYWKKEIANLIYWTSNLEKFEAIKAVIESNGSTNKTLCNHLKDIVELKIKDF